MPVIWEEAEHSVVTITEQIVRKYHPELIDLKIGLIFRNEPTMSQGRRVIAKVFKVDARLKIYLDYDIIIWVAKNVWGGELSDDQRQALIDHELCHVYKEPGEDLRIIGHDIEEFNDVITRWGYWSKDIERSSYAFEKARQKKLFEDGKEEPGKIEAIMTLEQFKRVAERIASK